MTLEKLYDLFEKHSMVESRGGPHDDLYAMNLLAKLVPDDEGDLVQAAEHDQIWFSTDLDKLAAVIDESHVRTLCACGVWIDTDIDTLSMHR
jgi:hypothetical protein